MISAVMAVAMVMGTAPVPPQAMLPEWDDRPVVRVIRYYQPIAQPIVPIQHVQPLTYYSTPAVNYYQPAMQFSSFSSAGC